jgi:hypothetical protein
VIPQPEFMRLEPFLWGHLPEFTSSRCRRRRRPCAWDRP